MFSKSDFLKKRNSSVVGGRARAREKNFLLIVFLKIFPNSINSI